jgi:ferritin-like metal-binding protein YciE
MSCRCVVNESRLAARQTHPTESVVGGVLAQVPAGGCMARTGSLRTHLVDELIDLLDAENQLTDVLPKLAQAATSKPLRGAFQRHLKETRGHVTRLNQALRQLGEKPSSKTCAGMQGLLEEGEKMMKNTPAGSLRDAVLITGAQKVEHYEMASYGTARTYAWVLGEKAVARLLDQTLKEEKTADRTLTKIAEGSVNGAAAEEWQSQEEDSLLSRTAEWAGTTAGYASRQVASGLRSAASRVGLAQDRTPNSRVAGARTHGDRPAMGKKKP